jgi:hypothetical protein
MPESSQIALSTAGKDRPDIAMPNDSGDAIEFSARPSDLFAQPVVQPDGPLWISKADLHRTGVDLATSLSVFPTFGDVHLFRYDPVENSAERYQ